MSAVTYLRSKEWSMGNGQCPECCGAHAGWYGHPCHLEEASIGHKVDCSLAASLKSLAENVLYLGTFIATPEKKKEVEDAREARRNSPEGIAARKVWNELDDLLIVGAMTKNSIPKYLRSGK